MLGHWARRVVLAGLISGLCAPVWANAMFDGEVANSVTAQMQVRSLDGMQLAQTDLTLEALSDEFVGGAIAESIEAPVVMPITPPTRIALLLPSRSEGLSQVSDAVRAGFMAAWQHERANIVVNLIETGETPEDVLAGYQNAVAGNDIVVGPLTRSGVTAIVQNRAVVKPTIALAQPDATEATSSNLLAMGLSVEDEARQIAASVGGGRTAMKAFAISTNVSWQRRAAAAFASAWRGMGLQVETIELAMTSGFINPNGLLDLRNRIQTARPVVLFVALDAAQTVQLRVGVGGEVSTYGISQLNPHSLADWMVATPLLDLEGVRLLDMPWQLQADHAAVMTYPRLPQNPDQRRSPDIERLYALGIDAYRVAHNIAIRQTDFDLDGVTGKLSIRFGSNATRFKRVMQPAVYRQGVVQPLENQ
ncbi:penicillin-binding protein activator [Oxalicibacterium faecigallinarum]|nr:penicillin-binding protein activator [Oxalicibacterium faecigallinarum]